MSQSNNPAGNLLTGPTAAYGQWVATVPADWSNESRHKALRAFIDVLAVMVPGARDEATETIFQVVRHWGDGPATVFGHEQRLSAPWAALINGVAAHALDFDDNFDPAKAHATAVIAPALLTLAEVENAHGRDVIDAYIVGLQILCVVGQGMNPYHRSRGWHATATLGAVGAAAACARLLKLDADKARNAISMSTSLAAGFMSQFGTMTKPLHAGLAAKGGIMAAQLARGGVTAGPETLEGPNGMGMLMVGPDRDSLREGLKGAAEHGQTLSFKTTDIGTPLAIDAHGLKVKRYPNCGSIHRSLDGLLELKEKHKFTEADVADVRVRAPAAHLANLMYHDPQKPMQARFSMEFAVALGLVNGAATLADYEEGAIFKPEIRAAMQKATLESVDKLESEFPTEVIVTLTTGDVVETRVAMPIGSKANPLTDEQLLRKFRECAKPILGNRLEATEAAILNLDSAAPVWELMQHFRP